MMKLARLFCCLIIFGSSAIAANAQTPVDPKTIISEPMKSGGDPPCGGVGQPICITVNNSSHPLVEPYSPTFAADFEYCPPDSSNCTVSPTPKTPLLTQFFLEFTNVPAGTQFGCQTNVWVDCGISTVPGTLNPVTNTETWEFDLAGGYMASPPTNCNFNDGIGGKCPGFLAPGAALIITNIPLISETPEPDSIILFGTGLIAFFVAAKRRFHAQT